MAVPSIHPSNVDSSERLYVLKVWLFDTFMNHLNTLYFVRTSLYHVYKLIQAAKISLHFIAVQHGGISFISPSLHHAREDASNALYQSEWWVGTPCFPQAWLMSELRICACLSDWSIRIWWTQLICGQRVRQQARWTHDWQRGDCKGVWLAGNKLHTYEQEASFLFTLIFIVLST